MDSNTYEVVIIGGGVCGTALLYTLSKYTNVKSIALIEKETDVALINSFTNSNSQTLHFGDIETNYTLAKAEKVNAGASLVKNYLLIKDQQQKIYTKYHKMVLGVGAEQVNKLKDRYQKFKQLFPDLRLLDKAEITKKEPKVLLGRETDEEVRQVMTNLRSVDCDIITIGQYLQPSPKHLPVQQFITPEQFDAWRVYGENIGFLQVVSSPLTRSSYHAEEVRELMKLGASLGT